VRNGLEVEDIRDIECGEIVEHWWHGFFVCEGCAVNNRIDVA